MENEEAIRQQMEDTRTSLTEKLETLEEKLVNTVEETTTAVNETVTAVKETVQESVSAVKETVQESMSTVKDSVHESVETVKDWLDVKAHVEQHPWYMVGGSIACGFLLGSMLGDRKEAPRDRGPSFPQLLASPPPSNGGIRDKPQKEEPSWTSSLLSMFGPEIDKLKGLALGATLGTVREMITSAAPPHMGQQIKDIIDNATKKLGGEPIPSTDWENCPVGSSAQEPCSGEGAGTTTSKQAEPVQRTQPRETERFRIP